SQASQTGDATPRAAGVIMRMASADSPAGDDHHLSVSASCRPGEQLLAGGYAAVAVFESDYSLLSFYPAADNTWTVSANSGSSYQLQAFAYCLVASPSLGIRALRAATCPEGMARLASGIGGANPDSGNAGTPYVLCAAHGVTPTAHGVRVGAIELDCASHATGSDLSESRTFSYTCVTADAAS
ncbi:MAG TPA: hypothetical protein VJR48_08415, partial [Ktedonobacterales bacterium]|nr:hypothetical protein [Ktedonobacterales bacterium]